MCSILLIYVLLPFVCTFVIQGREQIMDAGFHDSAGREYEEALPGLIASTIPQDYPPEALKAQAVILRTLLYNTGSSDPAEAAVKAKLSYQNGWSDEIAAAVADTRSQILYYQNEPLKPAFHYVSAGRTRNYRELGKGELLPYLRAVDSLQDENCEGYSTEKILYGITLSNVRRDSSGYVLSLTVSRTLENDTVSMESVHSEVMSGEAFREQYALNSSNFIFRQKNNKLIIRTYGIGHGIGLSQYGAKVMALEGKTYREILSYYLNGSKVRRFYN